MAKNLSAMQETRVQSLGQEDPLEKGMATHSSILAREPHGQRNLAGCRAPTTISYTCTMLQEMNFAANAVTVPTEFL